MVYPPVGSTASKEDEHPAYAQKKNGPHLTFHVLVQLMQITIKLVLDQSVTIV